MKSALPSVPIAGMGVDLDGDDSSITNDHLRMCRNLIPDRLGDLVKRPSMSFERTLRANAGEPRWGAMAPFGGGGGSLALCNFYAIAGDEYDALIATSSYGVFEEVAIRNADEEAPNILPSSFALAGKIYFFNGKMNLAGTLLTGQPNNGLMIEKDAARASGCIIKAFTFSGTGNEQVFPRVAASYKRRVAYANLGDGYESHLVLSDRWQPALIGNDVLAINGRNLIIGQSRGDSIVGLKEVMMQGAGSPAQSGLLILKTNSCHMLLGEPDETSDAAGSYFGSMELNEISSSAGCVSQHTFANTPWGFIWCGPDDVWFMPFGARPIPIGRKLRPLLKKQPEFVRYKIHAAYHDGFYRLALFSDGQGPNDHSPLGEQWWLDLRDAPPENWAEARWYGPQVFRPQVTKESTSENAPTGTYFMFNDYREGAAGKLFGVQYAMIGEALNHTDYGPTLVSYEGLSAFDVATLFMEQRWWQPSTIYEAGDTIVVAGAGDLAILYAAVITVPGDGPYGTGGTSGTAHPVWGGANVVDNDITWNARQYVLVTSQMQGNEVLGKIVTKSYDFDDRKLEKLPSGLEISGVVGESERLTMNCICDNGRTVDTVTKDRPADGLVIGVDPVSTTDEEARLSDPSDVFSIDLDTRRNAHTIQFSLEETSGVFIPEAYRTFKFRMMVGGSVETVCTAVLDTETGFYSTMNNFQFAVIQAMTAVAGGSTFSGGGGNPVLYLTVNADGYAWSPWPESIYPYDEASAYIWGLLGYVLVNGLDPEGYLEPLTITPGLQSDRQATRVYRRVLTGAFELHDVTMKIRGFKRRPT